MKKSNHHRTSIRINPPIAYRTFVCRAIYLCLGNDALLSSLHASGAKIVKSLFSTEFFLKSISKNTRFKLFKLIAALCLFPVVILRESLLELTINIGQLRILSLEREKFSFQINQGIIDTNKLFLKFSIRDILSEGLNNVYCALD